MSWDAINIHIFYDYYLFPNLSLVVSGQQHLPTMNAPQFFLSEVDGHLYRDGALLRKNIAQWNSKIKTVADLKGTIRAADRTFGATDLVLFTDDGAELCSKCARSEFRQIAEAVRDNDNNGWHVVSAAMDDTLDSCECSHCGAVIVEGEDDGEEFGDNGYDPDDAFVDSDPWRGGPDGDMFG